MSDFDAITVEHLRKVGGTKWARYPDTIGAFIAEMDFGIAEPITRALHEAVDLGAFGYLAPGPVEQMATAYAQFALQRYGWQLDPEDVHPLPDVLTGLGAAIRFLSRPDSPIIIPTPAYMPFLTIPQVYDRSIIEVPMHEQDGHYTYDLEALDAAFAAGGHLLVLCNPHNPIGRVLTESEMLAVAEVVERHGGRVFADEIHAPLVFAPHRHIPYASLNEATAAHAITATSTSKAWNLPGLKAAQLILSNDADRETWRTAGPIAGSGTANLGVIAATAAYTEGTDWLQEVLEYLEGNRHLLGELLAEHLPEARYAAPEGTYLGWVDLHRVPIGQPAGSFFRRHAKVMVTDGNQCGAAGKGFIRYNFATPRPLLIEGISRLGRAVREHGAHEPGGD
ncbi:MAG TPA: aminotransferase class I/II-fold pyridoxal phosphate-dependent enzyme [Beutenbergiaceae bacterium]|nr:aminotransferase class I/II-fold pyridoxal phosphate-dependent enzyme [Beutenbergiaceae bacterium]